jgi:type IV pilus assembly protein PilB
MKKTVKDQSGAGKLKIGELLSKAGYITLAQLENAKKELQKNGGRLSSILRQLDYIDENTVFNFLSRQHNYPPVVIQNEPPSKDALKLLPYETAKVYLAFPLRMAGNTLQITMAEPTDSMAVEELQNALNKELSVCVSTEKDIVEAYKNTMASAMKRRMAFSSSRKMRMMRFPSPKSMTSARFSPRPPMTLK